VKQAEFDKFADEYRTLQSASIAASGEPPEYFWEYKVRDLAGFRKQYDKPVRLLDFGSGIGTSIPYFDSYFPGSQVISMDVSLRSLVIGSERFRNLADFVQFDGSRMPFRDETFDIVFAACVFHHIPESEHVHLLRELRRILVPAGLLAVFEHNPWNPLTRSAVDACPFDENAQLIPGWKMRRRVALAGFQRTELQYRIFFPRFLARLRPLESYLMWLPLGGQYVSYATR
jgi:ubiquinone/menaquinone biosynthesis C-methylase UbiE